MKNLFYLLSFTICTLCSFPSSINAQDDAAMMKAWEAWMTPGDMHKWMAKSNGTWSGEVNTYWDPAKPEKSKATATYRTIYNGLYQTSEFTGMMMGQPFLGQGILAYDNAKKQFVNTWIDNMGSGVIVLTGQYDPKTNTLHLNGTQTDPMTSKDSHIRQTVQFLNEDTQLITMYGPGMDGKEMKMMDIRMTRAK
jgi:uncharacterized protein DUF1579